MERLSHGKDDSYHDMSQYPNPLNDTGIGRFIAPNEYCACKSLEQLHHWFTEEDARTLAKTRIYPYKIVVRDCVVGDKQVLFTKKNVVRRIRIHYSTGKIIPKKALTGSK
ncbi:MAG: hypothetical protein EOM61_08025 [Bacteroidia bacterium]|nr:hypothetical protein [Bacteroidia bacterium]